MTLGCTSRPASLGVEALTGGAESSKKGLCGSSASAGVASLEGSRDCDGEDRPVRVGAGARDGRGRLWLACRWPRSRLWYEGDREGEVD